MQQIDQLIIGFDRVLRTLTGQARAKRPSPAAGIQDAQVGVQDAQAGIQDAQVGVQDAQVGVPEGPVHTPEEPVQILSAQNLAQEPLCTQARRHSAGLMRVNHTGEVCAQALYQGQALTARRPLVQDQLRRAANEEIDHLAWCEERLQQLDERPSVLNPLFYGLSFGLGAVTGLMGDRISLGFVEAIEDEVCRHLQRHLDLLPPEDARSRAIVATMYTEEAHHGRAALQAGGVEFPRPLKQCMSLLSKVMTATTYRI